MARIAIIASYAPSRVNFRRKLIASLFAGGQEVVALAAAMERFILGPDLIPAMGLGQEAGQQPAAGRRNNRRPAARALASENRER